METNIKSYRLKQEDKDYIFITSMVGRTIKLACKTSSGHTFSRKFTLNELKNSAVFIERNSDLRKVKKKLNDRISFNDYRFF